MTTVAQQETQLVDRLDEIGAKIQEVRDTTSTIIFGQERVIETPGLGGQALVFAGDGAEAVLHLVASGEDGTPRLYRIGGTAAEALGGAPPVSTLPLAGVGGRLVYQTGDTAIAVLTPDGKAITYAGAAPATVSGNDSFQGATGLRLGRRRRLPRSQETGRHETKP